MALYPGFMDVSVEDAASQFLLWLSLADSVESRVITGCRRWILISAARSLVLKYRT